MGRKALMNEDEVKALHAKMTAEGKTYSEVAKDNGFNPSSVYNLFKKHKLEFAVGKRGRKAKVKEVVAA